MEILTSQCPLVEMLHFRGRVGALQLLSQLSETLMSIYVDRIQFHFNHSIPTLHSGLGWKNSDSRPGNNFWDKWSRTFLPIHRNQPRPYLVIFWTHVLVSSGGVWRGMRKWSIFGQFCLNLQHNLFRPPGSKFCVRRVSPGPKFPENFEFKVRFQM